MALETPVHNRDQLGQSQRSRRAAPIPGQTGANVTIFRGDIPVAQATFIADGATQTLKLSAPPLLGQMSARAFEDRRFVRSCGGFA